MGGGGDYYDRDVTSTAGQSSSAAQEALATQSSLNPEVLPFTNDGERRVKEIITGHKSPIVIAVDLSGSMNNWPKIIWDKLPLLYGQICMQGYLEDPAIAFCGIDDIDDPNTMQITEFAQGGRIDDWISKIWMYSGGSGPAEDGGCCECYAEAAWFWANRCRLEGAQKPFFFFCADEMPRKEVSSAYLNKLYGVTAESVPTRAVFAALRQKFNVFVLYKPYGSGTSPEYDRIHKQRWAELVGPEHVLEFPEPKAVVDVMLGAIAVSAGTRNMDRYVADLQERGQSADRIEMVTQALRGINMRR